ncbi:MAG: hypothetical protein WD341_08890 [Tistlia sp.]|uniref:hypothetical protein n=1 Tax=Tistlia sp. TaxID=3057121 RepID=UPI0034A40E21
MSVAILTVPAEVDLWAVLLAARAAELAILDNTLGEAGADHSLIVASADEAAAQAIIDAAPLLDRVGSAAAAKRRDIHAAAAARIEAVVETYPLHERESWDQQWQEAQALAADPEAEVPLLTAIAAARVITVAAMAAKVTAKRGPFAAAAGAIIGSQQALEDSLQAALDAFDGGGSAEDALAAIAAIDPADVANWP